MDVWIKRQFDELMDQWQMGGKIDQWVDEFSHFTKTLTHINTGGPFGGLSKFNFYFLQMDGWMYEWEVF